MIRLMIWKGGSRRLRKLLDVDLMFEIFILEKSFVLNTLVMHQINISPIAHFSKYIRTSFGPEYSTFMRLRVEIRKAHASHGVE